LPAVPAPSEHLKRRANENGGRSPRLAPPA
jgi:hypothetical protein